VVSQRHVDLPILLTYCKENTLRSIRNHDIVIDSTTVLTIVTFPLRGLPHSYACCHASITVDMSSITSNRGHKVPKINGSTVYTSGYMAIHLMRLYKLIISEIELPYNTRLEAAHIRMPGWPADQ